MTGLALDRPLTILVVDDEPANRLLVEAVLQRAGHRVVVAASGLAALEIAETGRIDLVLMDLGLPDLDGFETTRRLRATRPALRVFALTADDEPHLRRAGAEVGMAAFLTKPISPAELLAIVGRVPACGDA